jgi:hypothetical protein
MPAQVYVGAAIEPLVDFLCSELAAAFRAEGATLPPWRAADAMLSKWRPRRSVDCDMLPPNGSFRVRTLPSDRCWCLPPICCMNARCIMARPLAMPGEGSACDFCCSGFLLLQFYHNIL